MSRAPILLLAACLVLLVGAQVALATLAPLPAHPARAAVVLLVAGLVWAGALGVARRHTPTGSRRGLVLLVVVGAVALRGVSLTADPGTSDDIARYVWEGGLVVEGESPYAFAPDAPERIEFRERWAATYVRMNNRDISAAYPPLAQACFAVVVGLAGGPAACEGERATFVLRVVFAGLDLAVLAPLLALLHRRGRSPALALAWGWCPLVSLEFAGAGHFDVLGVLLLVAALASLAVRRERVAAGLLAAGGLVKLLPIALLPFALRDAERRRASLAVAFGVLAVGLASVLLLAGGFAGIARGSAEYGLRWEAGSLVYRFVQPVFDAVLERDGGALDARRVTRVVLGLAWLAWIARAYVRAASPARAAFAMLGAFLVLTPTLHPWYVAWIVPLLALFPSRAYTWLVVAAPLLYAPLPGWRTEQVWVEPAWLWPVLALPFGALLIHDRWRGARSEVTP
jgi:hypothetical protein